MHDQFMKDDIPKVYIHGEWKFTVGRIIEIENANQRIYLIPLQHFWRKHLMFVRALIELGEIKDYNDLVHYCNGKIELRYSHKQPVKQMEYR